MIDLLKDALAGVKYNKDNIKKKFDELGQQNPELAAQIDDVSAWLISEIEG